MSSGFYEPFPRIRTVFQYKKLDSDIFSLTRSVVGLIKMHECVAHHVSLIDQTHAQG